MEKKVKSHGILWFLEGTALGMYECPECGNIEIEEADYGEVKLNKDKYSMEFKCLSCGYHAVFERTQKEVEDANEQ